MLQLKTSCSDESWSSNFNFKVMSCCFGVIICLPCTLVSWSGFTGYFFNWFPTTQLEDQVKWLAALIESPERFSGICFIDFLRSVTCTSFFHSWPFDSPNGGHDSALKRSLMGPNKVALKNLANEVFKGGNPFFRVAFLVRRACWFCF